MDKEKEIQEMTSEILGKSFGCDCTNLGYIIAKEVAETLFNAGYGNIKQAVKEFAEKLKEELWKFDGSWQEYDGEELCETVDNLLTELYGADE